MKLIAHRGNTRGPNPAEENSPVYILNAIKEGYEVEIDVWYEDGTWLLGHDFPQYEVNIEFLRSPWLWCHAKNITTLEELLRNGAHCFWHQTDDVTLTSLGYIWTFPGKQLAGSSICVLPEKGNPDATADELVMICAGICSDYIENYKD